MTTATAPPQHLRALELANSIRLDRARIKREVAAGLLAVAEVIADPPTSTDTMTVAELLRAQRGWGRHRAQRFLSSVMLSERRTIGALTDRQRVLVVRELERR